MDFGKLRLFDMVHKNMRYLGQRQDVLAQNVANADTPDYQARDLVPLDFKKTLSQQFTRLDMDRTTDQSMRGTLPVDPKWRSPEARTRFETNPDGNSVVLEEQLQKIQETNLKYQTTTDIYKKYISMMKMSMGHGGGG